MKNSRQNFEFMKKHIPGFSLSAEDVIKNLANRLLESLYIPATGTIMFKADHERMKMLGVSDSEPINFGSLNVADVRQYGDTFRVEIEEAAPGECPTLCEYMRKHLESYGWNVIVTTEW